MDEYIERGPLLDDLRGSYDALMQIYKGLKYDEVRQFCSAEIGTFLECILRVKDAPAADVIEVGSCDGCYWKGKGRFQKCTYCRRNRNLKDRYIEEGAFDG